jgi:DNA repair exonuclease SbcCD ATPase subunit
VPELKELPKVIDANRKSFREKMEALQEEIRRPVTEIENREKEIDGIKAMHLEVAMCGSAIIREKLDKVKAIQLTADKWKESLSKAEKAVAGEVSALNLMLQEAEKREQEARELEELRRKQAEADRIIREQKIKEEAERRAAEAERKAQEAREREEAARNSKEAMERAAIGAQQAVPMSKTMPQPKPSKWTDEQKTVNKAVYEQIAEYVLPEIKKTIVGFTENGYRVAAEEAAKAVVKAILTGKIRNLKVEY